MIAELRGVSKHYGEVAALRDVTLGLEAGRVTALLGPNGAGKTTAVKLGARNRVAAARLARQKGWL